MTDINRRCRTNEPTTIIGILIYLLAMIVSILVAGPCYVLTRDNMKESEMKVDEVLFHFRDKEFVGTVIVDGKE